MKAWCQIGGFVLHTDCFTCIQKTCWHVIRQNYSDYNHTTIKNQSTSHTKVWSYVFGFYVLSRICNGKSLISAIRILSHFLKPLRGLFLYQLFMSFGFSWLISSSDLLLPLQIMMHLFFSYEETDFHEATFWSPSSFWSIWLPFISVMWERNILNISSSSLAKTSLKVLKGPD